MIRSVSEMERDKCIVCGQTAGDSVDWAYFERGMSEKLFLCDSCYSHKVNLLDFSIDEKTYNASKSYMEARVEGKVAEIRNVVEAWINGEGINYFPEPTDLVYYAEGPEAHLFVFKDRVVILSSKVSLSYTEWDTSSIIKDRYRERKEKDIRTWDKRVVLCNGKREVVEFPHGKLLEVKEMNYLDIPGNRKSDYVLDDEKPVDLDISLGEYGTLSFNYSGYADRYLYGKDIGGYDFRRWKITFRFFYHQNQLMEEIYNYIQCRLNHAEEEKKETLTPVQKVTASGARRMQAKESTDQKIGTGLSLADEISKLKGLLDCGILTQEEFDKAKNKLIDMM